MQSVLVPVVHRRRFVVCLKAHWCVSIPPVILQLPSHQPVSASPAKPVYCEGCILSPSPLTSYCILMSVTVVFSIFGFRFINRFSLFVTNIFFNLFAVAFF